MVIAATAPGYATGQRLGDGPIAVPDGASLVFLVETGQVVTVKGPYDGPPPAPKADAAGRIGRLARLGGTDQSQIGGTRALANPEDLARAVPLDLYARHRPRPLPGLPPGRAARARPPGQPRRLRLLLAADRPRPRHAGVPGAGRGHGTAAGGQTLRLTGDTPAGHGGRPELDGAQLRCMAAPEPLEPDLVQAFVASHARALSAPLAERLDAAIIAHGRGGKVPDVVLAQLVLQGGRAVTPRPERGEQHDAPANLPDPRRSWRWRCRSWRRPPTASRRRQTPKSTSSGRATGR